MAFHPLLRRSPRLTRANSSVFPASQRPSSSTAFRPLLLPCTNLQITAGERREHLSPPPPPQLARPGGRCSPAGPQAGDRGRFPAGLNSRIVMATTSSASRTESTAGSGTGSSRRSASRCGSSRPAMAARSHTSPYPTSASGPRGLPGRAGCDARGLMGGGALGLMGVVVGRKRRWRPYGC